MANLHRTDRVNSSDNRDGTCSEPTGVDCALQSTLVNFRQARFAIQGGENTFTRLVHLRTGIVRKHEVTNLCTDCIH